MAEDQFAVEWRYTKRSMAAQVTTQDDLIQHIVISRLVSKNHYYVCELIDAHAKGQLSSAAWHTRNLLEILIWSGYCIASVENARRFCLDAVRDANDMMDIFRSVSLENVPEVRVQLEQWANLQPDLTELFGVGEVEKRYQRVRTIAQGLGVLTEFEINFKLLSKYVHPTALFVMIDKIPDDVQKAALDSIAHRGVEWASQTATMTKEFCLGQRAKS